MTESAKEALKLPPDQEAIRAKCFHPTGTFVEFPKEDVETSIPARFEKIVRLYGNRLATKVGEKSLTYDQLNRYANRIARTILEKHGFGSEPIALFFEKSIELVAAIFGVLKSGKCFVVLDPSLPPQRLKYVLSDSGTKLVVTDQFNLDLALQLTDKNQALITTDIYDETYSSDNLDLHISPQDLAWIEYTSGSTATPKGIVVLHRIILQDARQATAELRVCPDDRFTLLHSLSFGSGHSNLRLALLNGASLFGFDTKRENIERLITWLKEERVTIYHSAASLFRLLADSLPLGGMYPDLRLIRLSGAPILKRDFELYKTRFASNTLFRIGMGASEMKGICSAILDHSFSYPREGFPIGYPRRGVNMSFVDDDRNQVPPGEVGEIAVETQTLSPGYWNGPNATNDKFLSVQERGAKRIYLTGDLGRMLPDGLVVHLGRKNLMVKIRGYRVDFSEVERALLEHPDIKEVGVKAWDLEEGEKYLAGYVVLRVASKLNASEIRKFLANKLPDYMIPTSFKFVETLPMTNGKLDRLALPKPDTLRPKLKATYVAPRNEVERKLATIWSEVLQIEGIGIHDNFFDLGGHSLMASRVLSRVLAYFRVEIPLTALFESPTLDGFAQNLENVLRQEPCGTNLPLVPVPRNGHLPTTFGQQALWLHDQLEPRSSAYNLHSIYRLSGELDVQLLKQSINQIIARHEALRTVFEVADGQPVQKILPVMTIDLEVIDLSHLVTESSRDSEVRRFVSVQARQPFDLARGPLLRSALLRFANNEYVLFLAIHHVVFDAWSTGVFFRELSQIYNSLKSDKPCPLPELGIQYADFAAWQRERLCDANLESSLSYWKSQLGNLPALSLPTKRALDISERSFGGREEFEVSRELLDGLLGLAHRSGTTLFVVLLTAWKVALHRYTGQTDISIGISVGGRNHPAVEELIGYFLNLVVLRSDLSGDPTVRELLERIRRVSIGAFAHQDVPFEKLVEELRPARYVAANPLVQAAFGLQNTPKESLRLTGINAEDLDIGAGVARPFDLYLYVIEEETRLRGYVSYNKGLFEGDTIKRLINHLKNLLKAIAADKGERISALPMLAEEEKHQLLVDWNDTKTDYPRDRCVHELFENQAEKTPNAVAVIFENQQLTYRELNQRANQLAHYLKRCGVGSEVLVGICLEQSLEMVVGLLGILKAGGAYVPLDPLYPKERLAFILQDSQIRILLTQQTFLSNLGHLTILCLDRDRDEIGQENAENPENRATPENLAYVIYTSGSTGVPKGVMIPHRGLVNYLSWATAAYEAAAGRGSPIHSPIGFDLTITSLFAPLLAGRPIELLLADDSVGALSSLLRRESGYGLIKITPAHLESLRQELPTERLVHCTRTLVIGGEALTFEKLGPWIEYARETRLINEYGPTETVVGCCVYEVDRKNFSTGPVPIGRPIANAQIYILDRQMQPVPIGVAGEIHIGGDGLARGYLNRGEETKEKFIAHPFSSDPNDRLYKTGDLGRYLADGNIEFLGRIDNQVKLRGYRIELGEIEALLGQHPMVQSSVVVVREDVAGDKRLVAYVVGQREMSFEASEIRKYLKQKLPEYMIPSAFVLLDELPLTPNGKVDRKALPAPDHGRRELGNVYQAPRTPVEETIASIWSELLKVDRIGIQDNFFELGGHSLLATQVMSRVRSRLSAEVPLRTLFESPTVEQMAAAIMEQREEPSEQEEHVFFELESPPAEGVHCFMAEETRSTSAGKRHE